MTSVSSDASDVGADRPLADVDDVADWLAEHVYAPDRDDPVRGAVGLEVELFPFWLTREGAPAARLALVEMVAILDEVAERDAASKDGRPSWHRDEVLITEEPGAQLELAGPPDTDADRALERIDSLLRVIREAFSDAGAGLASAGLDLWSDPDEVPVQLDIPRYRAMSSYFEARGGRHGHLLMCASCSIQVNVDLGPPDVAARRWEVANLVAPILTAAFAASPKEGAINSRAMGWRQLDPTRTGVAPPLVAGEGDPVGHVLADVLRADVMMVARDDAWHAGAPGWTFDSWLTHGHTSFGPPTVGDLEIHLTTLFPEARLRGFLEVRTLDALPTPWRAAAVSLVTALFYDDETLTRTAELLAPLRPDLPALLERAARAGLTDPLLRSLSTEVLDAALDGVVRLGSAHRPVAEDFLARFTHRGRCPSDELAAGDARWSFDWSRG